MWLGEMATLTTSGVIGTERAASLDLEIEGRALPDWRWSPGCAVVELERSRLSHRSWEGFLPFQLVRGASFHERLGLKTVCVDVVALPVFRADLTRAISASVRSNSFGRECESGIPDHALLAGNEIALQFDDFPLVGHEGEVVLERPERTCGGHIAALGAEAHRDPQGLE